MKLIGISGTNGSGKDTAGGILAGHFGYEFLSVTDALRDEAKRRGLEPEREVLRTISAEWRREVGLAVLVDKAVERYQKIGGKYVGLAIASLRNPAEADRVHELGGTVLWLDADPRLRYDRIQAHKRERNRTYEDDKTFERFLAEEQAEMHASGDAATLDMAAVKAKADVMIINEFPTPDGLASELAQRLHIDGNTVS